MRVLVVAVLLSIVIPPLNAADEKHSEQIWFGVMDVGVREFRFRIEPVPGADVPMAHQLVSLDEGSQVFRLDGFQLNESLLQFELKRTRAAYSGTISEDGSMSTGKWKQAGQEFDLVFRRFDATPADNPSETWSGTVNALFQKLKLRFRVYCQDDGTEIVRFDSVSQKTGGFKGKRAVDGKQWTIDVDSLRGSFKGTMNADGTEVTGKWTQNGLSLELTLIPETTAAEELITAPSRPQTPAAPFPYLIEKAAFTNETDGVHLEGTLTIPHSDNPVPAVILISGSGPQDRDESIADHKPFWVIADHLSRHGIAVLRFDDRGTGASTGSFSTATSEGFSRDVEAAFEFLLKDPRIREDGIGLIGHSEGGIIAPIVAARRSNVAFAILLAGTGVNGREILLSQGQLILRAEGVSDETTLNTQRQTQLAMIDTVLNTPDETAPVELVAAAMVRLTTVMSAEALQDEQLKVTVATGIAQMRSPWFRFFLTHEPGPVLEKVKCPILALNGEKDVQVDPRLNLPAIRGALEKSGNKNAEAVEMPGLNHLFQTCSSGGVSEYQAIEETVSPVVLEKMTEWIRDVVSNR